MNILDILKMIICFEYSGFKKNDFLNEYSKRAKTHALQKLTHAHVAHHVTIFTHFAHHMYMLPMKSPFGKIYFLP